MSSPSSRPPPHHIRLGTASPSTNPAGLAATLQDLARLASRAAANHIDVLLLPEAYLGGYPRGSAFGAVVGGRSDAGRDEYSRYFRGAVDLGDIVGDACAGGGERWVKRELGVSHAGDDGANNNNGKEKKQAARGDGTREELERIARETGVFIVTGLVERAGGSLYCAVVYVDPRRGMLGKRRKVMPTGTERVIWAQAGPATLKAVSTTIRGIRLNMAAAICWENYMPLLRQAVYMQNVNLWLAPTADAKDAWASLMRTIGVEGRCFVVASNMATRKEVQYDANGTSAYPPAPATNNAATASASASASAPQPTGSDKKRRKSVIVEDGHEIVLCCDDDDKATTAPAKKTGLEQDGSSAVVDGEHGSVPPSAAAKAVSGPTEWACRGGSMISGIHGEVLAGPQWEDDENFIWADVNFDDCVRGRLDSDAGGSYSRSDSFKLSVEGLDIMDSLPYY